MSDDVISTLQARGFVQQVTDEPALRALLAKGPVTFYSASTRPAEPAAGQRRAAHGDGPPGARRPPADRRPGRRHRHGRRPQRQDRAAPDVSRRGHRRPTAGRIEPQVRRYLELGGRARALLVNNADWLLQLRYIEFLRDIGRHFSVNEMLAAETYKQPAGEGPVVRRVQLPAPAGLRLPAAVPAPRLRLADRRRRPVGQHRRRRRSDPAGRAEGGVRADLPAADDRHRREDGQDRRRARSGFARARPRRTTSTSTGSTSTTATWAASCGSSPSCRCRRSSGWRRCRGRSCARRSRCWPSRRPRIVHGDEAAEAAQRAAPGGVRGRRRRAARACRRTT